MVGKQQASLLTFSDTKDCDEVLLSGTKHELNEDLLCLLPANVEGFNDGNEQLIPYRFHLRMR